MRVKETNEADPAALALGALGWILADENRADRFLALTGLTPDDLRRRLDQPGLQAAILSFLEAHEPDLIACAEALGAQPADLVQARARLES